MELGPRYKIGGKIGEGSFGHVYLATEVESGEKRAIKRLKSSHTWENTMSLREIQCLCRMGIHDHIVRLYEVQRTVSGRIFFVFEYMSSGSLYELMLSRRRENRGPFEPTMIRSILHQALQGLAFIHERGFMHRDLKPENLLMAQNTCKIADFSVARRIGETAVQTTYVSTRWYRAPELLLSAPDYSTPIDVFAMGCIAAELFRMMPLFPGHDETDQLLRIFALTGSPLDVGWKMGTQLLRCKIVELPQERHETSFKEQLQQWLGPQQDTLSVQFLVGMLALEPSQRYSAPTALNHAFFLDKEHLDSLSDVSSTPPPSTFGTKQYSYPPVSLSPPLTKRSAPLVQDYSPIPVNPYDARRKY